MLCAALVPFFILMLRREGAPFNEGGRDKHTMTGCLLAVAIVALTIGVSNFVNAVARPSCDTYRRGQRDDAAASAIAMPFYCAGSILAHWCCSQIVAHLHRRPGAANSAHCDVERGRSHQDSVRPVADGIGGVIGAVACVGSALLAEKCRRLSRGTMGVAVCISSLWAMCAILAARYRRFGRVASIETEGSSMRVCMFFYAVMIGAILDSSKPVLAAVGVYSAALVVGCFALHGACGGDVTAQWDVHTPMLVPAETNKRQPRTSTARRHAPGTTAEQLLGKRLASSIDLNSDDDRGRGGAYGGPEVDVSRTMFPQNNSRRNGMR